MQAHFAHRAALIDSPGCMYQVQYSKAVHGRNACLGRPQCLANWTVVGLDRRSGSPRPGRGERRQAPWEGAPSSCRCTVIIQYTTYAMIAVGTPCSASTVHDKCSICLDCQIRIPTVRNIRSNTQTPPSRHCIEKATATTVQHLVVAKEACSSITATPRPSFTPPGLLTEQQSQEA